MKLIKNLLFYLLLIISLCSCKSTVNVVGTYLSLFRDNPHKLDIYRAHRFVINADSTFNYSYIVIGEIEKYSSGTWRQINSNTIILNSDIQSKIMPLDVDIIPSENKDATINVTLIIPEKDEKDYRCIPYFELMENYYVENFLPDRGSYSYKKTNYYSNNHELFFKVSKEPYGFIPGRGKREYYLLDTEHKKITTNDGDIVNITVSVPDSLFSYRVFNNTKIKFKGDKLFFRDAEEKNKMNKLYLNK